MNNVGDLELNVLGCLLIKPELMNELIVEDKHFIKHQRTWQFIKACYKKFGALDISLMYSVCSNKYHLVEYLEQVMNANFDFWNFEKYQKRLIEQYEESKKDKWIKDKIYILANDLYVGNIKVKDFQNKISEIYDNAEQIFNKM